MPETMKLSEQKDPQAMVFDGSADASLEAIALRYEKRRKRLIEGGKAHHGNLSYYENAAANVRALKDNRG
jgi:predicted DNA-binding WGR domain protein